MIGYLADVITFVVIGSVAFLGGNFVANRAAVARGWLFVGNTKYRVIRDSLAGTSAPPRDNLGDRVKALFEAGAFDSQIDRAIRRNNERRGS